jgi:hypothetical protein
VTPAQTLRQLDALLASAEEALARNDLDALSAAARAKGALVTALADTPADELPRDDIAACADRVRHLGRLIAARRAQVDRRLWQLARATGRNVPLYGADGQLHTALSRRS